MLGVETHHDMLPKEAASILTLQTTPLLLGRIERERERKKERERALKKYNGKRKKGWKIKSLF